MIDRVLAKDISLLKIVADGCCTYCHLPFGSLVLWRGRRRFLEETRDHILPRAVGGRVLVPCCQVCNSIKGSLVFDSLSEIQDYCLNTLLKEGFIPLDYAVEICVKREEQMDSVVPADLLRFLETPRENNTLKYGTCQKCQSSFVKRPKSRTYKDHSRGSRTRIEYTRGKYCESCRRGVLRKKRGPRREVRVI